MRNSTAVAARVSASWASEGTASKRTAARDFIGCTKQRRRARGMRPVPHSAGSTRPPHDLMALDAWYGTHHIAHITHLRRAGAGESNPGDPGAVRIDGRWSTGAFDQLT